MILPTSAFICLTATGTHVRRSEVRGPKGFFGPNSFSGPSFSFWDMRQVGVVP